MLLFILFISFSLIQALTPSGNYFWNSKEFHLKKFLKLFLSFPYRKLCLSAPKLRQKRKIKVGTKKLWPLPKDESKDCNGFCYSTIVFKSPFFLLQLGITIKYKNIDSTCFLNFNYFRLKFKNGIYFQILQLQTSIVISFWN